MFGVDELGLDLGTSTLHMVVRGKGIVLSEPAYVAYDRQTRNVVAVGEEARRMYGRTPAGLIVERPLRDGRIRSFDLVSKMLRYFLRKVVGKRATFRPKLLLALPGGMALPLTWEETTLRPYETRTVTRTRTEAEELGARTLSAYLLTRIDGAVTATRVASAVQGDWLLVTLSAECLEQIGETVPILTD